ncbi:MAG: hypothetical protein A2868_02805 [Candidatus Levybacteria bacterium RIFCSPHIGHO2_01_FULL_40_15b]|nr:MAG: hypothetical protein A2868_02805 [Candidatus Levybacteria bacterium RIFCSPHIGHO2_01_FULL_40_15b]
MRKLLLGFSVFLALFYLVTHAQVIRAQTNALSPTVSTSMDKDKTEKSMEATESSKAKDDYSLPYPGILPDNPLHFLKALRDRIILMLISDPIKEAEFNLLTSDKRIYAAQLLADRGKDDLSVSTLSKSNNYFYNAISSVSEAKRMGKRVDVVLNSMKKSIVKHQEVLSMIRKVVSSDFSNQLQIEEKRMLNFEKSVDNLLLK